VGGAEIAAVGPAALGGVCADAPGLCLDPLVALLLQGALALLFASTAWHKLRDLPGFEAVVTGYGLLPRAWAPLWAHALVLGELAVALALVWGATPWAGAGPAVRAASAGVIGLMTVYAAGLGINLARGRRDLDCGCSGPAMPRQTIAPWLLARNAVVAGAAALLLLPLRPRALHWVDGVTWVGGVSVLALCWIAVHGLAAAAAPAPVEWAVPGDARRSA